MSAVTGSARHARPSPRHRRALPWSARAVLYALTACSCAALACYGCLTWPARTLTVAVLVAVIVASPRAVRRARCSLWKHRHRGSYTIPARPARFRHRRDRPAAQSDASRRG